MVCERAAIKYILRGVMKKTKRGVPIGKSTKELLKILKNKGYDISYSKLLLILEMFNRPDRHGKFLSKISRGLITLYYLEDRYALREKKWTKFGSKRNAR